MRIVESIEQMIMSDTQSPRTHLFIVRVWLEDLGDGKAEWRGQLKYVISGEVRYFREWNNLITILQELLTEPKDAIKDAYKNLPESQKSNSTCLD